jgi:hypothetical protein
MSPPEVWGPAVWTLIHTLSEKVSEQAYPFIKGQLFAQIKRICGFLPCPECSADATNFLAKININDLKTKVEFRNTFYLFHNWVNVKKRKPLFNYSKLAAYNNYGIVHVINNFISKYNTNGNMKLLSESFQRKLIVSDFKSWFTKTIRAFTPPQNIPSLISSIVDKPVSVTEDDEVGLCCGRKVPVTEEVIIVEEHIVTTEQPIVTTEQPIVSKEEPIVTTEQPIVSKEEPIVSKEEPIVTTEQPIVTTEQPIVTTEEHIVTTE